MDLAQLDRVSFTYAYSEKPALVDVSATLREGVLYGLVGTNGSGKTTLCQLLRGIVPYFHEGTLEGSVRIMGTSLESWERGQLALNIGCVFENPFTQISGIKETVFEEIGFGLENLGVPRNEIFARVEAVIDSLRLGKIAGKNPNFLSGGQRQKVAFASIVAMDAQAIVIDEPTSQLDPEASNAVFEIIEGLRQSGKTIVLAEHKVDQLARIADEILVLSEGRIVAQGPTNEILTSEVLDQARVPYPEIVQVGRAVGLKDPVPMSVSELVSRIENMVGSDNEH